MEQESLETKMNTLRSQMLQHACLAALLGGVVLAGEHEQLPRRVAKAIKDAYPTARISDVEREREKGAVVYEVGLRFGRREIEVEVDAKGVIGCVEEELEVANAPRAVVATCKRMYPGADIDEIERCEVRGTLRRKGFTLLKTPRVVYEVELGLANGRDVELTFDGAGELLHRDNDGEHGERGHDGDDKDREHGKRGHDKDGDEHGKRGHDKDGDEHGKRGHDNDDDDEHDGHDNDGEHGKRGHDKDGDEHGKRGHDNDDDDEHDGHDNDGEHGKRGHDKDGDEHGKRGHDDDD